jgi:hypothetical protein
MYISAILISRFQRRSDAGLTLSVAVQALLSLLRLPIG